MNGFRFLLFLAGDTPELPEMTTGGVLSGICILAALAGSLGVLSVWWGRYSSGQAVIPPAQRPVVRIPTILLVLGLLIALLMMVTAITSSFEEAATEFSTDQLLQVIGYDLGLIAVLGGAVLLLRRRRDLITLPGPGPQPSEEISLTAEQITDDSDSNPYRVGAVAAEAVVDLSAENAGEPDSVDSWVLWHELKLAGEVCLGAWLPTVILRVTLLSFMQDDAQHPFLDLIQSGAGVGILLLIAGVAVILAPLMEELLYRVIILGGLIHHSSASGTSILFSVGVTSVLFAFAHGFPDSVALLPLAVAITWTYYQRRSFRTVVLVHVMFNGFNVLVAGLGML